MNDLIKRSDALREILAGHDDIIYIDKNAAAKRIKSIPAVDPEQEYLDLICEIQHQAIKDGRTHVGSSSEWCIFGSEIKSALESLSEKRKSGDAFI